MKTVFLVHGLLEESTGKYSDKDAVVFKNLRVSYKDINEKANQLAHSLINLGIKKGDRVVIYLDKCVEQVISIFAISKIGAIFVIINPVLNESQVSYIIDDCSASGIISSGIKLKNFTYLGHKKTVRFIVINNQKEGLNLKDIKLIGFEDVLNNKTISPKVSINKSELASIIYTSGSTGMPKGVMLTHENIVMGANSVSQYLRNNVNDIILSLLPLSFDYGLNQLTTCFKVGATLFLKTYLFPEEVIETIEKEKISGLAGIPTIWIQLLQAKNISQYKFEKLRYITNSGDRLSVTHVKLLRKTFPFTKVFLMYGLTEAFRATYLDPKELDRHPNSVGKAIPYAKVFVVNKNGEETKPKETGELIQTGPLVSRGYWGRPQDTAQKIRQNPLNKKSDEPACFSGDLFQRDGEGFLYFIGRESSMIKSLGYRISPTEIESELYKNDSIKEAVAIGVYDELMGQKIKAVVTLKKKNAVSEKSIINYCTQHMPNYMVPAYVEIIDNMPLTSSGKIDRQLILKNYGV